MLRKYSHKEGNNKKDLWYAKTRSFSYLSDNYSTVMRDKNSEALIEFDFAKIIEEMELKIPTLLYFLQNSLKANTPRGNEKAVLAIIASMIFKHRRSSCSLLQRTISLILYAGHTAKQVNC